MRISKLLFTSIPWYLKPFFCRQKKKYGQILMPSMTWAQVPPLFMSVACLYGAIDRKSSPLSPELRSLITVRVSQINWCRFCVDINSATFMKRAGSEEKLSALENWRKSSLFSDTEKAVLNYAEKMTYTDQHVNDECFTMLKKYFDQKVIIELTALIAFQNLSSKFNSALNIEPQGFCGIPNIK